MKVIFSARAVGSYVRLVRLVMAQWVNHLRNNIFVNPSPLLLLCEISGVLHLAQLGLTLGRWQSDEIQVNFEIF